MNSLEKLKLDNNYLINLHENLLKMSALKVVDVRGNIDIKENDKTIALLRKRGVVVITDTSIKA